MMNKLTYYLAGVIVRTIQKLHRIYDKINLYHLRHQFKRLGSNALIETPSQVMNPQCISIGDDFIARAGVKLRAYTTYEGDPLNPEITIGNNVHLAADVVINCTHRIDIGNNTGLGVGTKVMDHMHGLPDYSDLHIPIMKRVITSKGPVIIKDNVMVGAGCVILAGVEIGEHAFIGSNSVVTRSIPPYSIATGAPAKVIRILPNPGVHATGIHAI
jgi:acetyltransferase-like isoleucine patch superfamily enzyme